MGHRIITRLLMDQSLRKCFLVLECCLMKCQLELPTDEGTIEEWLVHSNGTSCEAEWSIPHLIRLSIAWIFFKVAKVLGV